METLGAFALLLALVLFAGLYQTFLQWLLPKIAPCFGIPRRWFPPDNFCPRCEHTALKHVYYAPRESYPRPTPNFYLCEHCGARWLKLFNGPLKDASDSQYDYYYGPGVPYYARGESDNGKEPMEIIPYETNWVKCPNCGWRFRLDTASWSGEWPLHTSCGQRLKIKTP
jgi:hypothetical protein